MDVKPPQGVDVARQRTNDRTMSYLQKLISLLRQQPLVGRLLGAVDRSERWLLFGILAAVILYAFIWLAGLVRAGGTRAFDEMILLALRTPQDLADPIGPRWLEEMVRDFTALGSTGVLSVIVLALTVFLLMTGKGHAAVMILISVVSGVFVSQTAKWAYARPRPELVPHGAEVYTASFPSGHSMMSAVVYLTLGALLARTQPAQAVKVYILSVAAILTLLVGISRIYLGVHWPTDVLAGWCLGGLWALMCSLAMLWLQTEGKVEGTR
jgi:undecaprenyl-diphosphatase